MPSGIPEEAYPGYLAPVVVKSRQSERVACGLARFGLIPGWAKDDKISRHTYNARSETAAEKPSYRTAWRQRQFGLLLVDNFYEPSYESGKAVRWKIELASELMTWSHMQDLLALQAPFLSRRSSRSGLTQ